MSAYVIGHITVKNVEKWDEYLSQVPATLEQWRGRLVFFGRSHAVLEGEHHDSHAVVIQFPDQNALQGWYGSPEYQALVPLRSEAIDIVVISYDE